MDPVRNRRYSKNMLEIIKLKLLEYNLRHKVFAVSVSYF